MLVTVEVDVLDANLGTAVYVEIDADSAADHAVSHHLGVYIYLEVALLLIVTLDNVDGSVFDVVRVLTARAEVQTLLEVFLFSGLDAAVGPAGYTGTLTDADLEPSRIGRCAQGIDDHGHVFKITLGHQALDYTGNFISGNGNLLTGLHTRQLDNLVFVEILVSFYANTAHYISLGTVIVYFYAACPALGLERDGRKQQGSDAEYLFSCHSS
jgi:hypothetical protein